MQLTIKFKINEKIYLKDPETSDLGKQIIKFSIDLIAELGFEAFTFKKLAQRIETTEASVYRYFENKHKLLLYISNLYWSYLEYLVTFPLNTGDAKVKLENIIKLLTNPLPDLPDGNEINKSNLHQIIIAEGSKAYLIKDVSVINQDKMFQSYKDLCEKISTVINEYNPKYKFPHSLASTIVETAFSQQYFKDNLPRLTDAGQSKLKNYIESFLKEMVFKILS